MGEEAFEILEHVRRSLEDAQRLLDAAASGVSDGELHDALSAVELGQEFLASANGQLRDALTLRSAIGTRDQVLAAASQVLSEDRSQKVYTQVEAVDFIDSVREQR